MIPDFRNCSTSPDAGLDDDRDGVGDLRDVGLALADADRLDDDDVERGGQRRAAAARGGGEAAEAVGRPPSSG